MPGTTIKKAAAIIAAEGVASIVQTVEGASCAKLSFVPDLDLAKIRKLEIHVVPEVGSREIITRAATKCETHVGVAILKKLGKESDIEGMLLLEEEIAEALERAPIDNGFRVMRVDFSPLYDPAVFRSLRVFMGVVLVTVSGVQE